MKWTRIGNSRPSRARSRPPADAWPSSHHARPPVVAAFTPGSVVAGRFRIDGWLGEGGLAEVFSAVDPDGRELALKALHPHLARLDEPRGRCPGAGNHPT